MHIAVNARLLLPHRIEGISRFAEEVLRRMAAQHPEAQFTCFFDRPYDPRFVFSGQIRPVVVPPQARHPLLWYAWFHLQLPRLLDALRPDLFFSPEGYLSGWRGGPQVPVFHDLAFEHYPEHLKPSHAWYFRHFSPRYARQAARILTVSEFTRQDLAARYGVDPGRIGVVGNGASAGFRPLAAAAQEAVRARWTQGAPYFLFVGTVHPRKNIETLLAAFDRFKTEQESPVQLLLAGRQGWNYSGALRAYESMQHRGAVRFTGYLSEADLREVYGGALALCYLPWLEGFGIPVLEAFDAEIPVLCSDRSAIPEVAGDAALLASPGDAGAIAAAMQRLWTDAALRASLVARGRERRLEFSWDRTASKVWDGLMQALQP
ncbi:MAG: glycosyltransferase family 1 protein [Bacteroidia bacterium]|nr:glycosyltransferase family 1 protein [Bacteroidia bacterium]